MCFWEWCIKNSFTSKMFYFKAYVYKISTFDIKWIINNWNITVTTKYIIIYQFQRCSPSSYAWTQVDRNMWLSLNSSSWSMSHRIWVNYKRGFVLWINYKPKITVKALKDHIDRANVRLSLVNGRHVGVYCVEYNSIDIDTINEIMRDHRGKVISGLVARHICRHLVATVILMTILGCSCTTLVTKTRH